MSEMPSQEPRQELTENPYAVSADLPLVAPPARERWYDRQTYFVRSVICWSAVCIISAVPSFGWGYASIAEKQVVAMLLGILTFIVIYVFADLSTKNWSLRGKKTVLSATLRVVYIIRITASVVFPLAFWADSTMGYFAMSTYGYLRDFSPTRSQFIDVYAITLIQGGYLNLVLIALGLPISGVITLVRANK